MESIYRYGYEPAAIYAFHSLRVYKYCLIAQR